MEIKGTVKWVGDITTGTSQRGNEWRKREFVVEYEGGEYPKCIKFDIMNEDIMNDLAVGVVVTVKFSINVREWNGRMFNDIRIWSKGLELAEGNNAPVQAVNTAPYVPQDAPAAPASTDDLPF